MSADVIDEFGYIVYFDSPTSFYQAKNGYTDAVDYSDTDAATVINDALNNASSVVIRGEEPAVGVFAL
jgi:hypothetical protein